MLTGGLAALVEKAGITYLLVQIKINQSKKSAQLGMVP
jgi:hypothetical protein